MRVVVSGGGTGGHIYPAIAVADRLRSRLDEVEILFIGALGRMEMDKVPRAGYDIVGLPVAGIQRRITARNLQVPFRLLRSISIVRKELKRFRPDVAVGFGGYASGPALWMAGRMGVPTVLQEQNSYAGLTNKILARRASAVCVAYPGMERYFPEDKIVFTGNPVRGDLLDIGSKRDEGAEYFKLNKNKKTLLLFGGSLGAKTLNEAMRAGAGILEERDDIQVLWQMGKLYSEQYSEVETAGLENVHAVSFIDRMDLAYAVADVVMCRAGALTISELCLAGKPAILVPSPNVAEDHQTQNARALVDRDAAVMVADRDVVSAGIGRAVELLDDTAHRDLLSGQIKKLARPGAADEIVDVILKVVGQ